MNRLSVGVQSLNDKKLNFADEEVKPEEVKPKKKLKLFIKQWIL